MLATVHNATNAIMNRRERHAVPKMNPKIVKSVSIVTPFTTTAMRNFSDPLLFGEDVWSDHSHPRPNVSGTCRWRAQYERTGGLRWHPTPSMRVGVSLMFLIVIRIMSQNPQYSPQPLA